MSSILTKQIDGDVAIGRNVTMGGTGTVRGSLTVGHNLTVEGWLEAKNIKGPSKGLFKTAAQLREAYPNPQEGWWALVTVEGSASSDHLGQLYMADGGAWVAQVDSDGNPLLKGNPTIDSTEYMEAVEKMEADLDGVKADVNQNEEDIKSLRSTQTTQGDSIHNLSSQLSSTQSDLSTLKQSVSSDEAELAGLESGFESFQAQKGQADGFAPLNEDGIIDKQFLPSSVDSVVEFDTYSETTRVISGAPLLPTGLNVTSVEWNTSNAKFLALCTWSATSIGSSTPTITTGYFEIFEGNVVDSAGTVVVELPTTRQYPQNSAAEIGKLYVCCNDNVTYRWDESNGMSVVGRPLTLGEEKGTAYPGNKGKEVRSDVDTLRKEFGQAVTKYDGTEADVLTRNVVNVNTLCALGETQITFSVALEKVKSLANASRYMKPGIVLSFLSETGTWQNKQWTEPGSLSDSDWTTETNWTIFGANGTAIGNTVNANVVCDDLDYTLTTAVKAVLDEEEKTSETYIKNGVVLTYRTNQKDTNGCNVWEAYQFVGDPAALDYKDTTKWVEFGGGSVGSVYLGETELSPDDSGKVTIPVDNSLDADSENLVPNKLVTQAIQDIKDKTVANADTEEGEAETTVTLVNQDGGTICTFSVPRGGGSGESGEGHGKITISAALDKNVIKAGDSLKLSYTYDHLTDEQSDGTSAEITVRVKIGTAVVMERTYNSVSAGTYSVDLSEYTQAGTIEAYVLPTVYFSDGTKQSKTAYAKCNCKEFGISTTFSPAENITLGGYDKSDTVAFNIKVTGTGTRVLSMYLDGTTEPQQITINGGTATKTFNVKANTLTAGTHTAQFVAEADGLLSNSIYVTFLVAGGSSNYVGIKYESNDGTILTGNDAKTPHLEAQQYEALTFTFAAYDPNSTTATVTETVTTAAGEVSTRTLSMRRTSTEYSNRFRTQGATTVVLSCGKASQTIIVNVSESSVQLEEYTADLALKLTALGRSNNETSTNRATWKYNDTTTNFIGFDWSTNGWMSDSDGEALKLTNGAKAVINYQPFLKDVKSSGLTVEIEFKVGNVSDLEATLISCLETLTDGNVKGFEITGRKASLYTGMKTTYNDEENEVSYDIPVAVSSNFASNTRLRVGFVVGKSTDKTTRLIQIYVNGILSGSMSYSDSVTMRQEDPQKIILSSATADLYVYSVRVYNTPMEADDMVNNYIVDRPDTNKMFSLYESNNILNDSQDPDMQTLIKQGKGVIHIIRDQTGTTDGIDDINKCSNKKTDFAVKRIIFYTPWGEIYRVDDCKMRIQGTSSTKYPVKNYRFYVGKSTTSGYKPTAYVDKNDGNGFVTYGNEGKAKIPLFIDDKRPVATLCAKADFSDSSMTSNTGMAKMANDMFLEIAPTPPQQTDTSVRSCIYGYPVDIFASTTEDDANPFYCGQYNLNHDKSDWYDVTGMTDSENHIALEFLNNSAKIDLFQVNTDAETQFNDEFDEALEFNYPKDTFWNSADTESGETNATDAQKNAVLRLWKWVRDCVPSGASYDNIDSFKSTKFATEVGDYFVLANLCTWYLLTDYDAMVDQRAKNMILRTWDLAHWYFTYYDGDCQFGKRNDSKLAYEYDMNRDTYDTSASKYAFEGHDSVLWCLVLANLQDTLSTYAVELRKKLTPKTVKEMLNVVQMGNWCERLYNRSGFFKYIKPEVYGYTNDSGTLSYPAYMYALNGSAEMHRNFFIENRYKLLDAKWSVGDWKEDTITAYFSRKREDAVDTMLITSAAEYYYGWGTNNGKVQQHEHAAKANDTVTLSVDGERQINDPIRIYGASKMLEADLSGASDLFASLLDMDKCTALRVLDLSVPTGGKAISSTGFYFSVAGCGQLRTLNVNGQTNAKTSQQEPVLDLSKNSLFESLDARGTQIAAVTFADGAPVTSVQLPATLTTLDLRYLSSLKTSGITFEGTDNVTTLVVVDCPGVEWQTLMANFPNVKTVRIVADSASGDGTELQRMVDNAMSGIGDDNESVTRPVVRTVYHLTNIMDTDDLGEYITDIEFVEDVDTYTGFIASELCVGDSYNGATTCAEPTLDNIGEDFDYFNGETAEEFTERFEEANASIYA